MFIFSEPDRDIDRVFIHCSASSLKAHDDVEVIRSWHLKNGWSDIGYTYYITFDGTVHRGRDVEIVPAAQRGHNTGTIAICLSGLREDDFTQEQFESLRNLCEQIDDRIPDATFHGHCEVSDKKCPVFDYCSVLGLDHLGAMPVNTATPILDIEVLDEARKELIEICQDLMDLKAKTNLLNERVQFLGSLMRIDAVQIEDL